MVGIQPIVTFVLQNGNTDQLPGNLGSDKRLCLLSDQSTGKKLLVNVDALRDPMGDPISAVRALAGSSMGVFVAVAGSGRDGDFAQPAGDPARSGIALVKVEPTQLVQHQDAEPVGIPGVTDDLENSVALHWDQKLQRLFVGLRVPGGIALLVGRIDYGNVVKSVQGSHKVDDGSCDQTSTLCTMSLPAENSVASNKEVHESIKENQGLVIEDIAKCAVLANEKGCDNILSVNQEMVVEVGCAPDFQSEVCKTGAAHDVPSQTLPSEAKLPFSGKKVVKVGCTRTSGGPTVQVHFVTSPS
jgi:hypothetical protein